MGVWSRWELNSGKLLQNQRQTERCGALSYFKVLSGFKRLTDCRESLQSENAVCSFDTPTGLKSQEGRFTSKSKIFLRA